MPTRNWTTGDDWVPEEFVCKAIPMGPGSEEPIHGVNGANGAASTEVVFPDAYYRLFNRDSLAFPAEYRGRHIRIVVPRETLVKRYGAMDATLSDVEPVFFSNMPRLQELAKSLIQNGVITDEHEIVIH